MKIKWLKTLLKKEIIILTINSSAALDIISDMKFDVVIIDEQEA